MVRTINTKKSGQSMLGGAHNAAMETIDPWIHCQQMPSQTTAACRTATFASWNANALLPHIQQIAAMEFHVAALQEVRIPSESLASARKTIAKLGFNLVVGALPSYKTSGFNRRSTHVDQTIPGVGFLIAADVPYQEIAIPAMQKWVDKGRFSAIKAFLNNRWVHCFSAYAPVMDTEPFLDDILEFLQEYTAECCLVGMDANSNTHNGAFVHSMHASGWLPLTMCTPYDFTTYRHPNGSTSCIDTIIVSPLMQDHVAQINTHRILEKGHECLSIQIAHDPEQKPTWEIYHNITFSSCDTSQDSWENVFKDHKNKISGATVQEDWDIWCQAFAHIHTADKSPISGPPRFRTRDNHKNNKCLFKLCQAIDEQNFAAQKTLLDQIKKLNLNQIRKWRHKLQPKLQNHSSWCRHLFQWVKTPAPPIPSCIASQDFGVEGFTTSLHASLCEIDAFFRKVYKSPAEDQISPVATDADTTWEFDEDMVASYNQILLQVTKKANVHKVAGMDGLEVGFFKQLPSAAIYFLACIFSKAVTKHVTPDAWLHCKMTCIPKRQGKTSVKDLRPLTIAPVVYRLFCKTVLQMHQDLQLKVPPDSIGGVPGRSALQAWLPAALQCEASWKAIPRLRQQVQGAAIDTEKFFDNVPQAAACEALVEIGMDPDAIATWQYMLRHLRRYASLNGAVFRRPLLSTIGIPQGDPLSMIAAATLLGKWTMELPRGNLFSKVFVDDRLLLSHDNEVLLQAFHTTEFWDQRLHFKTKAKTVAFGNNMPQNDLWWTDATQVAREKLVVYLGIPLPLRGISSADFFEPIINKLIAVLSKIARARLTHKNVAEVIARKIIPAICYPCSVARPNKAQISALRTKIFAAAASRQCQTLDAHALFNEKTHVFDPQCAMIFHNLRFWRNVYVNHSYLLPQFFQCFENSMPLNNALFGPVTVLQKDLAWLNCHLHARDAMLVHPVYGSISMQEADKGKFEHFVRLLLRQKLAEQLEQKHVKWQGVSKLDLDTTTAFVRNLQPDSPLRVPMLRMFAEGHATPYKLNKMGILPTPHCKFCFHERADIQHLLWHCPRFQQLRESWPTAMLMRTRWPACAETALIFTREMDDNLKGSWKSFQKFAAELVFQWMEICRNPDLYDPLPLRTLDIPKRVSPAYSMETDAILKQKAFTKRAELLPLQWKPPVSRTDLNKWAATLEDFALIFSFWTRTTLVRSPQAVDIKTWSQALAIFVQVGGRHAPFLTICQNVGMAAYKFKALSLHLLNRALEQDLHFSLYDPPLPSKWLPFLPLELSFPSEFFFTHSWDLTNAAQNLHQLNMAIRINHHCSATAIRIATAVFIEAIPPLHCFLQRQALDGNWLIPTFAHKKPPPPWVESVLEIRNNPMLVLERINSITQISLNDWMSLTADEIRAKIPKAPGAKGRFKAALNRYTNFKNALATFLRLQMSNTSPKAHVVQPCWSDNETCFFCHKFMRFSAEPSKITRTCANPGVISDSLANNWMLQFNEILDCIWSILNTIS